MESTFDIQAAASYSEIIIELDTMLEALDEMRAEHQADKKQKKLFKVHSIEGKIRRLMKAELKRQNPPQLKLKIA